MDSRSRRTQGFGFPQLRGVLSFLPRASTVTRCRACCTTSAPGAPCCASPRCIATGEPWWLLGALLSGYSFAWLGHFRFEHNRPATFRYPFYSLAGDFRMWWELNLGKLKFREQP